MTGAVSEGVKEQDVATVGLSKRVKANAFKPPLLRICVRRIGWREPVDETDPLSIIRLSYLLCYLPEGTRKFN